MSSLKTILIQILACYFPENFIPIYNKEMMFKKINEFGINLDLLDKREHDLIKSNKDEDFAPRMLISNEIIINKMKKHPIAKQWDNITLSHFLFMCLPIEVVNALDNLSFGIKYFDPGEQFLVGVFTQVHDRLGYRAITRLETKFPDAEVIDMDGTVKNIEFEYKSQSFVEHDHDAALCDVIVCWHDDLKPAWKNKNKRIEIIAFEDITDQDSELYKILKQGK